MLTVKFGLHSKTIFATSGLNLAKEEKHFDDF